MLGNPWASSEEMTISVNQDLSFTGLRSFVAHSDKILSRESMRLLGMVDETERFTHLGLILSDQCPSFVSYVISEGSVTEKNRVAKDVQHFDGSCLEQITKAATECGVSQLLFLPEREMASILSRENACAVALKEALINALVHRSYRVGYPLMVREYDDGWVIASPCSEEENEKSDKPYGLVWPNPGLAKACLDMGIFHACGFGLEIIEGACAGQNGVYGVFIEKGWYTVVLPRSVDSGLPNDGCKEGLGRYAIVRPRDPGSAGADLLEAAEGLKRPFTREEMERILNVSKSTAVNLLRSLKDGGFLYSKGKGAQLRYYLCDYEYEDDGRSCDGDSQLL